MENEIYRPPAAPPAMEAPKVRRRRWWAAGLLGLYTSGLGQLYNGQWKKAVGVALAAWVLLLGALALVLWRPHPWLGIGLIPLIYVLFAVEAAVTARRLGREYHRKPCNRWYVYLAWIILVYCGTRGVLLGWNTYGAQSFYIPAASMEPTLKIGDYALVAKWNPHRHEIHRGDILIFRYPAEPSRTFIKRVVGLPGEQIEIRGRELWIDGRLVSEPYAHFEAPDDDPSPARQKMRKYGPSRIPAGEYFILGDNRDNSNDSRFWGTLPEDQILGGQRVVIYWSRDQETGEVRVDRVGRVGG
jgi:signal peptidase I